MIISAVSLLIACDQTMRPFHGLFAEPTRADGSANSSSLTSLSLPAASALKFGVWEGSVNPSAIALYESWLNRRMDFINDTIPSESWDNMVNGGFLYYFAPGWKASGVDRLAITIPMLPTFGKYDGPTLDDTAAARALSDGAAGAYDTYWITMRQNLIASGYNANSIRLGWEPNGNWYNWRASVNPTAWIAYYRRIVGILRNDPAAKFKFIWNPTLGLQSIAAELIYPGDDVVDTVGLDVYDSDWSRYVMPTPLLETQKEVWDKTILNGDHGLAFYSSFARAHAKPIYICEWGVGQASNHMGGDNPYFVQQLFDWASDAQNNVQLLMAFDDPKLSDYPDSAALFLKLVK